MTETPKDIIDKAVIDTKIDLTEVNALLTEIKNTETNKNILNNNINTIQTKHISQHIDECTTTESLKEYRQAWMDFTTKCLNDAFKGARNLQRFATTIQKMFVNTNKDTPYAKKYLALKAKEKTEKAKENDRKAQQTAENALNEEKRLITE